MRKMTGLLDKLASSRNNGKRSASNMINNSRPASKKNDSNSEDDGFGVGENDIEYTKKLRKLSKSGKSKSKKMSKS